MVVLAVCVAVACAVVALAAPASAKGATGAEITGDGIAEPVAIAAATTNVTDLATLTGLPEVTFGTAPDRLAASPAVAATGRHLHIAWHIEPGEPGRNSIVQEVYPDAAGGPLVYTAPGQPIFIDRVTSGGWYRSDAALVALLDRITSRPARSRGAPVTLQPDPGVTTATHRSTTWPIVALAAVIIAGAALGTNEWRRRRVQTADQLGR